MTDVTLAELCIFACTQAFRNNGEVIATGVGPVPRLAAGLAKLTHSPELMMTDGEAYLVEQPVPLGPRGYDDRKPAGYLPFSRFFDAAVWTGRRHAMVTPTQLARVGPINLSQLGGTHHQPKTQMLGVRGFPGNTIYHPNSFFFPSHTSRVFVTGEVDMVSGVGYNLAKRVPGGNYSAVDLRQIVTQPLYVPETMNALKILERFRKERNYFAVVVDEYGSTQGIITLHDLTENIFGALPDLDDKEGPAIVTREDGSLLVDGTIPIDELREMITLKEFDFEDADYSTLAGFILYKLSEIPKAGDTMETEGYRFEILDMDKSKIDKVLITKIDADGGEDIA